MKNSTNITIQDLEISVNKIFECQQKEANLKSHLSPGEAEMLLIEQLMKSYKLIDRSAD